MTQVSVWSSIYLSVCLSVCPSIWLSVDLTLCLSISLSVCLCLSVCLSPPPFSLSRSRSLSLSLSLSLYIYIYIRFDLVIPIADTARRTCEYHASIDVHNINLTCLLTGIHCTVIIFNIDTLLTLFVETICHWKLYAQNHFYSSIQYDTYTEVSIK